MNLLTKSFCSTELELWVQPIFVSSLLGCWPAFQRRSFPRLPSVRRDERQGGVLSPITYFARLLSLLTPYLKDGALVPEQRDKWIFV